MGAHAGDGLVYLPKEKVLCTGDVVANGAFNATPNANFGNWPNVIAEARKLDVAHVLPGHGRPGGKALLSGQSQFFIELLKAVKASIQQGKKLEDLVTISDDKPVSTTVRLPETVKNWAGGEFYATQVRDAYEELTQGKPRGDLTLGKQARRQQQ